MFSPSSNLQRVGIALLKEGHASLGHDQQAMARRYFPAVSQTDIASPCGLQPSSFTLRSKFKRFWIRRDVRSTLMAIVHGKRMRVSHQSFIENLQECIALLHLEFPHASLGRTALHTHGTKYCTPSGSEMLEVNRHLCLRSLREACASGS
jgi:hypothetical protein